MRHCKVGRNLGRMSGHRRLMFRNIIASLFEHEIIQTTLPKAKELRRFAEPLITMAKVDTVANRRLVFARLRNKDMVAKLFTDIAPRCKSRPGGYIRVLKCGHRQNDCAPMAIVELVDKKDKATLRAEKKAKQPAKKASAKKKPAKKES